MHSREKLHQFAIPIVCWAFALNHDAEIINYQVNVTKDSEDFYSGRANGESLVHDYVVSDVEKSDLDLVIIGHDHEDGYGEGYITLETKVHRLKAVQFSRWIILLWILVPESLFMKFQKMTADFHPCVILISYWNPVIII